MFRDPRSGISRPLRSLPLALIAAALPVVSTAWSLAGRPAEAAAEWHADLPTAISASRASGKPVLAVFVAAWESSGDSTTADLLVSPEVDAVVSACFEPVQLDVDAHPDLIREYTVEHVPAACILDRDQTPLTSFECPDTPAAFVAAAARAAQIAAAAGSPAETESGSRIVGEPAIGDREDRDRAALAVTDKVRQLSSFAEGGRPAPGRPSRFAPAMDTAFVERPIEVAAAPRDTPTSFTPAMPEMPVTWPAEPPAQSGFASLQPALPPAAPAARTSIQPATTPATPWLAAESAPPVEEPESTASVSDAPPPEASPAPRQSSSFWTAMTKPWSIFSGGSRTPGLEPPQPPPTLPPARPQSPAAVVAGAAAAEARGVPRTMPLGMEGFCPVTVVERGAWVEGRPQWGARHRGRTYLFAGPEQQQAFLADPDRYAPALSGDDPVLAFQSGRSEPGRRAYGVTYQSRMYLFSSPETRAAFSADPDRYTSRVLIAEGHVPADGIRRF